MKKEYTLRYSFFWNVMQRWLVVTDALRQTFFPILKSQAVQQEVENATDRLSRNVGY
jgi:hypothetical protein